MRPDSRLGPYQVLAKLGEGGMGEVWRAQDSKLRRDVALKVLPRAFTADAERLARFEREAQILAQLQHPSIAAIYGLEESDGVRALVMELAEGEDLGRRIARGAIPVDEALAIARQIAEGLEAAHEKGIVHRDLKPANVKVSVDGIVKILDFGLAKACETGPDTLARGDGLSQAMTTAGPLTEAGVILGTVAYMSPEQARGRPVDKRSDVWSFGVVLYEMLTGTPLFRGETATDVLAAVVRQEVDLERLPAELPPPARNLLERCLERDPKRRLRDLGEARLALDPAARASARPRAANRRRWLLPLALAGCVAAGFGTGWLWRAGRPGASASTGLEAVPITSSGNVICAAVSPDGRYVAYVESEQGAQSLWLQQIATGQTLRLLPEQAVFHWGHVFSPDGNSVYYAVRSANEVRGALYSISTLGGTSRRLLDDLDSTVTFSPDGKRIAFTRLRYPSAEETSLMVAGADGSNPVALATFRSPEFVAGIFYGGPSWSPDGRHIATAVGVRGGPGSEATARLALVSALTGEVRTLSGPGWLLAAQCGWLPGGKSLLVVARAPDQLYPQLWSVSYPGGEARRLTEGLNDRRVISLTADGRSLVTVAGAVSSGILSLPLKGAGAPRRLSRSRTAGLYGMTLTAEGKVVHTATVGDSTGLWTTGPDGADSGPLLGLPPGGHAAFPAVADDGAVFFVARGRDGFEIRSFRQGESTSRIVARDAAMVAPIDVARDGSFVVYSAMVNGIPRVVRVRSDGSDPRPLFAGPAFRPALHPSGKSVAFYHLDPSEKPRLGVCSVEGGPLLLDVPAELPSVSARLVLRDEGIYLNVVPGDRANVWLLPAGGGDLRQVTSWEDGVLFDFALSRDGASLAVARGPRLRDALLVTGFTRALGSGASGP